MSLELNGHRNRVLELHQEGKTPTEISRVLGIARTTIRDFLERQNRHVDGLKPDTLVYNEAAEALQPGRILRDEILPLSVAVPKPTLAERRDDGTITALLYGDTHFPYQSDQALAIVQTIAHELQPNVICHMGDLLDCYTLSRFDKDPNRLESLQDEIDMARAHLATMRMTSPNSRFVLLEGNHEDRLRRTLWGLKGEAATLNKLTKFRKAITWPSLLDLEDLSVEFVPYGQQSKHSFLPKFILKHGDLVRQQSAYTARGELDKYNRSGASGHTHRLGVHCRRDHHGNHVWIETGCTCTLSPDYTADPNWQAGCVVLTFDTKTGAVGTEIIDMQHGLTIWRGNVFQA
jgi:hypothetical protein